MFKLFRYLKPVWWEVVLAMIIVALQALLQLFLAFLMGQIQASIMGSGYFAPNFFNLFWAFLTGSKAGATMISSPIPGAPLPLDYGVLWQQIGWMILVVVLILGLAILGGQLISHSTSILGKNIRKAVFSQVMYKISLSEYSNIGTASLITRTTNDVEQICETYFAGVRTIIFAPITIIMAIVLTVTSFNPETAQLAFILGAALAATVILIMIVVIAVMPLFNKIQNSIDHVTMVFREGLTGVRVIRAFNNQPNERVRFEKANMDMTRTIIKVGRAMTIVIPFVMIIFNMTYIGIFMFGFAMNNGIPAASAISISDISVVAQFSMQVMMAFFMMAMIFIQVPRAIASARRINVVLDIKSAISDPENPVDTSTIKSKGVIEFKNVSFTFPDADKHTLTDLSFKTKSGKVLAIIGSTGSGKSSVINLIPRFFDATEGEVLLNGINIKDYSLEDLRTRIGFVPQQATLFSGTIRSNLEFGLQGATEDQMNEALEVAQAKHFVDKKENGLDSEVSQGGKNFSGGQKQRLSIARALIKKPEIYVFDDSFSALDFKTDIKLRKALKDYVGGSSIIIVAQRIASILDADNILVLQNGHIVAQGTHDELLHNSVEYQAIVESQLDAEEIKKTLDLHASTLKEGGNE